MTKSEFSMPNGGIPGIALTFGIGISFVIWHGGIEIEVGVEILKDNA